MFKESETIRDVYQFPEDEEMKKKARKGHKKMKTNEHVVYKEEKKKMKRKKEKKVYFKIRVIGKVAEFVNKLKAGTALQDPKFTPAELVYLNGEEELKQQNEVLISYENKLLFFFQVVSCIVLIINMWKASFEIVQGSIGNGDKSIEVIGMATCFVLAFFNLNSEMKNEKMALVTDKLKIRNSYKNNILFYDIMVLLGFIIKITPLDENFELAFFVSRALLLFLVVHIYDVWSKIEEKLSLSRESESVLIIFKLIMKILIFLHFNSLLLNSFAKFERYVGIKNTWVEHNGFQDSQNYELYIYAWYWSCTIMSTVGFGDINPASKNIYEKMLIATLEVFCCIVFGYFMNYIGSLLNILGESKASYEKEIRQLNKYLKNLQVNNDLKDQARSHIFNKYKTLEHYDKEEEDQVKDGLNDKLNENLFRVNNRNILEKCKLQNNFSGELLDSLADSLQKIVYSPEEFVFEETSREINLWIVENGSISEIPSKNFSSKPLTVFNKNNNSMGWINFLTGQSYSSWGWADSFTITYKLNRQVFLSKLRGFRSEFFKFHELKEYFIGKARQFEQSCLACSKMSHNVITCPKLHYIPKTLDYIIKAKNKKAEIKGENSRDYKSGRVQREKKKIFKLSDLMNSKTSRKSYRQFRQDIQSQETKNMYSFRLLHSINNLNAVASEQMEEKKITEKILPLFQMKKEENKMNSSICNDSQISDEEIFDVQSIPQQKIEKKINPFLCDEGMFDEVSLYREEYQAEKVLKKFEDFYEQINEQK